MVEIASEGLKFRVFEVSLADLQNDNDAERSFRKFRLIAEHVVGYCTRELIGSFWLFQTLIEANVDVKTTDGYLLRVFCIGFTNKDPCSTRKTCYAQHTQVRAIRKKMVEIISRDVTSSDLKEVVKVLKKPRFDLSKLMELHGDGKGGTDEPGAKVDRPESYEPPIQESV
ncbi:40S ribosomal protein S3a [Blattella germanica]|nr:40S ribosomal protein S3a [Blattella germanica]